MTECICPTTFECVECHQTKLYHDPNEIVEESNPTGVNYWITSRGLVCNTCWHELLMKREELKPCIMYMEDDPRYPPGYWPRQVKKLEKWEKEHLE